jgi:hypothetical protein
MHDLEDRSALFNCVDCGNEGREDGRLVGVGGGVMLAEISRVVEFGGAATDGGEEEFGEPKFDEFDDVGPRAVFKRGGSETL